jgi:tRNA-specific 2-thiouridylase
MQFLREHIKAKTGEIVTTTGQSIGQHSGLPYYTIGQREGIGVGGTGPYYVVAKDFKRNQLLVTNDKQDPKLWGKEFEVSELSWTGDTPEFPLMARVSIRYSHQDYAAEITKVGKDKIRVVFDEPQRAITPGQSAVIYNGEILLGGGVIQ